MPSRAKTARPAVKKPKTAKRPAAKRQKKQEGQEGRQASGRTLRVEQVRSGIGHAETYRLTLRALGLRHHQDVAVLPDNPSVRGMLTKVRHLVRVQAVEA